MIKLVWGEEGSCYPLSFLLMRVTAIFHNSDCAFFCVHNLIVMIEIDALLILEESYFLVVGLLENRRSFLLAFHDSLLLKICELLLLLGISSTRCILNMRCEELEVHVHPTKWEKQHVRTSEHAHHIISPDRSSNHQRLSLWFIIYHAKFSR